MNFVHGLFCIKGIGSRVDDVGREYSSERSPAPSHVYNRFVDAVEGGQILNETTFPDRTGQLSVLQGPRDLQSYRDAL